MWLYKNSINITKSKPFIFLYLLAVIYPEKPQNHKKHFENLYRYFNLLIGNHTCRSPAGLATCPARRSRATFTTCVACASLDWALEVSAG